MFAICTQKPETPNKINIVRNEEDTCTGTSIYDVNMMGKHCFKNTPSQQKRDH